MSNIITYGDILHSTPDVDDSSICNLDIQAVPTYPLCNGSATGAIDVTMLNGTAPYTYYWGAGHPATQDRTGLLTGTYNLIVTDANGEKGISSTIIRGPQSIVLTTTQTNNLVNGGSTGTINLTVIGGTAPYTYLWSNGATTQDISNLPAGTHSVVVTDSNGCTSGISATITQPTVLNVSGVGTNPVCGGISGSIDVTVSGGQSPYTYLWNTGATTQDLTALGDGFYSVVVKDANGAIGNYSTTLTSASTMVLSATKVDPSCGSSSNGSIDLTVTGGTAPYTYSWKKAGVITGVTTQDLTSQSAGTYHVTVTDSANCKSSLIVDLLDSSSLDISGVVTNIGCYGYNTGSIIITVTGGTAPYSYSWTGGITTKDRTGLVAGSYTLTVTDNGGCTKVKSFTISQPSSDFAVSYSKVDVKCKGSNTGSVILYSSQQGYDQNLFTFLWNDGATTAYRYNLPAGLYSCVVDSGAGCSAIVNVDILEPTAPLSITETHTNSPNGTINITPSGGTGTYTYNWGLSQPTTQNRTGLSAGIYTIIVQDSNGCTDSKIITIL